ncbi:MAG: transposase [Actinobacteria bacterium]|nr:transposase [Actinomycetota bacterium]
MTQNFRGADRDQSFLLPPSITDWLAEDHLAWFVIDAVDQIDMGPFLSAYRADGRGGAAYHPKVMLALLVYAYACGQLSSRKIEQACQTDIAFRVITGNQVPDHTAIARFRQAHAERFGHVFTEVLALCKTAGMTGVGMVAVDGTKLSAPAALSANRTGEQIDPVVAALIAQAEEVDAAEDAEHGTDRRGDEPPAALRGRADRRRRFAEAKKILDEQKAREDAEHEQRLAERAAAEKGAGVKLRGRKPVHPRQRKDAKPARVNTTDPESRMMPQRRGGFVQGWNAQAVVNDQQVILAAEITTDTGDAGQLHPMIAAVRAELNAARIGDPIGVLLADAGYASEANLEKLTDDDPDCYIATRNTYRNPEPRLGRRGPVPQGATLVQRMDRKVSTKAGKQVYRRRQAMIEPVFGQIKHGQGITAIPRRGKHAAAAEWKLIAASHNILKLFRRTLRNAREAATGSTATALG